MKKIPEGMHSITPHLVCAGAAKALEFYQKAFGATEVGRLPGPDGRLMHAAMKIGDSTVMLADEMPEWGSLGPKALKGSPVTIHIYVEDVDALVARAEKAGAKVTMPVADQFWGDRYGKLEDPFGHHWSVATHVRDVTPDEMPEWGSLGPEALKGSPVTIHIYVEDVDALVARAEKAGAKVTMPVEEQFWGDRYGKLEDPFGHHWSVATHVRDVTPEEMKKAMQHMSAQKGGG